MFKQILSCGERIISSWTSRLSLYLLSIGVFTLPTNSKAQTSLSGAYYTKLQNVANTTYSAAGSPGASGNVGTGTKTYYFGDTSLKNVPSGITIPEAVQLQSFQTSGSAYTYKLDRLINVQIYVRRQNPLQAANSFDLLYYEGYTSSSVNYVRTNYPYYPKMEDNFAHRFLGMGSDNLFSNTGGTNNNDIERVDVIISNGFLVENATANGFSILERGPANSHDACVVGIVTAIDNNNVPTAFAPTFIRVTSSNYNTSANIYGGNTADYAVLRRTAGTNNNLQNSDFIQNQGIGGIYFSFTDFNIANNTTIYGYAIFPIDFWDATNTNNRAANAVNWNNATYFPRLTSEANGGIDLSMIAGIVKELYIAGNVYHDANGLKDNAVNGSAIQKANGEQLYIYLINNADNKIRAKVPVDANGQFVVNKLQLTDMRLALSSNGAGVEGNTWSDQLKSLPNGWVYTGETFGINNSAGTGINDGKGANGSANAPNTLQDGYIAIKVTDTNIVSIDFGIQQLSVADDKVFLLDKNPKANDTISLDPSALQGFGKAPAMTGADHEDGNFISNISQQNNLPVKLIITSLPTNGTLYYGNTLIDQTFINSKTVISDISQLKLVLTGSGYNNTSFDYAYIDAAGFEGVSGTYDINWPFLLNVESIQLYAQIDNENVIIKWDTTLIYNYNTYFLEKITNKGVWETLVQINASTNKIAQFIDTKPLHGSNYYRLRMHTNNGPIRYSKALHVSFGVETNYQVIPNPVSQQFYIKGLQTDDQWVIFNNKGQMIYTSQYAGNTASIDVSHWENGTYFLIIQNSQKDYLNSIQIIKP